MTRRILALATLLFLIDGSAYAGNTSQDTTDRKDVSAVIANTNTWQKIADLDGQRNQMLCQNVGTTNAGLYINSYANGSTTPVPTGIGSAGVLTLLPAGAYEPDGGWVYGGAVWIIGTATTTVVTCYLATTQP